jgi:hypothetical protein
VIHITVILTSIATILTAAVADDETGTQFQGKWRITLGSVKLEQKGDAVSRIYGPSGQFPSKGTVKDNIVTFNYQEGQAKGSGRFTLDATDNAFTGRFQIHI